MSNTKKLKKSVKSNWFMRPDDSHAVEFYDDENTFLNNLFDYVSTGLENQEICLVIATPKHIIELNKSLRQNHFDVYKLIDTGQYYMFDAEDSLNNISVNLCPDYQLFHKNIGEIVNLLKKRNLPIRAYGEMVSILWQKSNKVGLLNLEKFWHELNSIVPFSLLCAYNANTFSSDQDDINMINNIKRIHNFTLSDNTFN